MKTCTKCRETLPIECFCRRKASVDGLAYSCKACQKAYDGARDGTEHRKKQKREATQRWNAKNRHLRRAMSSRWQSENLAKGAAKRARRRAAQLQRTPVWADTAAIDFVYHAAKVIAEVYCGEKPHVDHIVPLQGKKVSGLHVAGNLQLLSAHDNKRKGNNYRGLENG